MALSRDRLNLLLGSLTALLVLGNLDRLHIILLDALAFLLVEVDVWTHFFVFAGVAVMLGVLARRYARNARAIKKLSFVNYISVDEYERQKRETTKKALAELARNPKYLELKARLEREKRDGTKALSPPLTEDEDDLSVSENDWQ